MVSKSFRSRASRALPALILIVQLAPQTALAEQAAEPGGNWNAPPYWTPPPPAAHERHALVSGPAALPFIALPPCRLVDTRGNAPLTGGFLPPATVRSYTLTGVCGLPANAQAVSLNATVVHPTGPGFLTLYPQGGAFPPVSTLNYLGNDVIVNAAVVPLSGTGGISMALGVSGGDVVLDTNGYYAAVPAVTSLNALTGDVTLAGSGAVTVTPSGSTLTAGIADGAITDAKISSLAWGKVTGSPGFFLKAGDTMTGTLGLSPGNIDLVTEPSTAASGSILKNGIRFIHDFGVGNTFVGRYAGNFTMTGFSNTATGFDALTLNTAGTYNAAYGYLALSSNTTGGYNTANGTYALLSNTTGSYNAAYGYEALDGNTSGSYNAALGYLAGTNLTLGSNNVYIANPGLSAEVNTIRIGSGSGGITPQHFKFFVAAVRGVTTDLTGAIPVLIDGNGQLGTASSSIRFKDDVRDMGDESAKLMQLRPVTFRYKAHGPDGPKQYGLIAEEVDAVMPELVARSKDGEIETVMYQELPAILLNEIQRLEKRIAELERRLAAAAPER